MSEGATGDEPSADGGEVSVTIRPATKDDMAAVADMIQELADFEQMPRGPQLTVQQLQHDGFSSPPLFRCLVAALASQAQAQGPQPLAGYALYFPSYSTWRGRALALEDLYVRPQHRRTNIGTRLLNAVALEAQASGCCRVDFHVLEWNGARAFYERRGADDLSGAEGWRCYRLHGRALAHAAEAAAADGPH